MIFDIVEDNITSHQNHYDIIAGVNTGLTKISGIIPFHIEGVPVELYELGSVLTFSFDPYKDLHLIVCQGHWKDAARYIRLGIDYLWISNPDKQYFSARRIGPNLTEEFKEYTAEIYSAMAKSYARVILHANDYETYGGVRYLHPPKFKHGWKR